MQLITIQGEQIYAQNVTEYLVNLGRSVSLIKMFKYRLILLFFCIWKMTVPVLGQFYSSVNMIANLGAAAADTKGAWFVAPRSFCITALRVPAQAGPGTQSIQVIKLHGISPTLASTNFTTLKYISGERSGKIIPVYIPVKKGDSIGIFGTAEMAYSQTGAGLTSGYIGSSPFTFSQLSYDGNIHQAPAVSYKGLNQGSTTACGSVEIYYNLPTVQNDAGIGEVIKEAAFCYVSGASVTVRNYGFQVLSNIKVKWSLNGMLWDSLTITAPRDTLGTLTCDTVVEIFRDTFYPGMRYNFKVWTELPGGLIDSIPDNDTVFFSMSEGLEGEYTIGGPSANYPSLIPALQDLNDFGVCGPVTFKIRDGIYYSTNQYFIAPIAGTGPANRVTIRSESGNPAGVVLQGNATNTTVFVLSGARYITLKDLTIEHTGSSSAGFRTLDLLASASYDSIDHCIIKAPVAGGVGDPFYGCGVYATNFTGAGNVISNNTITDGAAGIYISGPSISLLTGTGNIIEGNDVLRASKYYIYASNMDGVRIRNNRIRVSFAYGEHTGISVSNTKNTFEVIGNSISTDSAATLSIKGLSLLNNVCTAANRGIVANNEVALYVTGYCYGLYSGSNKYIDVLHNSFHVNGGYAGSDGTNAWQQISPAATDNMLFRNNIFSVWGTTGYALLVGSAAGTVNSSYNLFYSTGTGLVFRQPSSSYSTLSAFRAAFPTVEQHSLVYRPAFKKWSDLDINVFDSACWALSGRGIHTPGLVTTDRVGTLRPQVPANGAPDLGAREFVAVGLAPLTTPLPSIPASGISQVFVFAGDTVAKITWAAGGPVPASVGMRYYTGTEVPNTQPSNRTMKCYWQMNADTGTYNYAVQLYYKDPLIGTVASETDLRISTFNSTAGWSNYVNATSSVNTTLNMMSGNSFLKTSLFTGTDNNIPLPVTLLSFNGDLQDGHAYLIWSTSSEMNAGMFGIERSEDGHHFSAIGQVKAVGNTNNIHAYSFVDSERLHDAQTYYYRLKEIDVDGSFRYSQTIALGLPSLRSGRGLVVYPNPFRERFTLQFSEDVSAPVIVQLIDISGKVVFSSGEISVAAGNNSIEVILPVSVEPGLYFLQVLGGDYQFLGGKIQKQ